MDDIAVEPGNIASKSDTTTRSRDRGRWGAVKKRCGADVGIRPDRDEMVDRNPLDRDKEDTVGPEATDS